MEGNFRVGEWLIQPRLGTITKGDQAVSLGPKVMEVLVYLAQHPDDVLSKERIVQAVWGDTFVTDEVLTNAVSELRKAFGDDAKNPHTIQTLPRRGYRLIAGVAPSEQDQAERPAPASAQRWRQSVILLLASGLLLAVVLILWWSWPNSFDEPIDSIAVLPFENATGSEENEYLSTGLAETVSFRLARLSELRVVSISPERLNDYKQKEVDAQEAAWELGVDAVLRGKLSEAAESFVLVLRMVDDQGTLRWGKRFTQAGEDLSAFEEDALKELAQLLKPELAERQLEGLARRGTTNPIAYQEYLKGEFSSRQTGLKGVRQAIAYYNRALEEDSSFALAYLGLSGAYETLGWANTSESEYGKARMAARTALLLDETLVEAHLHMAHILFAYDKNWTEAEIEFKRAQELNPKYGPDHNYLVWMGRFEEAKAKIEKDLKSSDPLSPFEQSNYGYRFYGVRDYERAIEQATKARGLDPNFDEPLWLLGMCYLAMGRPEEFVASTIEQGRLVGRSEEILELWRKSFEESGIEAFIRVVFEEGQRKSKAFDRAAHYALIGERDLAFEWLERTYELPVHLPFSSDARFDSLRDDPRFEQLLRKLNLPDEAIQRHLALR